MSEKEFECRWSKKACVFHKESGREPGKAECVLCFANAFRAYGEHLAEVLASIGVGRRGGKDFLEDFLEFRRIESDFFKAVAIMFPWIEEEADKRMSKAMSRAIIVAPKGISIEALEDAKRRYERGEIPKEIFEAIKKAYERGDVPVV